MSPEKLSICLVGDVGPRRNDPDYPYKEPIFALSAPVTREADIAFCQLDKVLSDKPNRQYFNTVAHPDNVRQLVYGGFDVVSLASNAHLHAGIEAFFDTIEVLKKNNIKPVGVGMNIAEARTPVIVEKKGTRVAFLGYSCILPKGEIPSDAQTNRPGCAPMYISTYYEATDWQPGMQPKVITVADKGNLEAMKDDISRAKDQADIVVISFHWGIHHVPGAIAMYQFEVGHAAIDVGADLIVGSHPHILKGIEVYKGKVIFYSLGNFGIDTADITATRGIPKTFESYGVRDKDPDYPTYRFTAEERNTMIAKVIVANKQIERVSFQPCLINKLGQPEPLSAGDKRSDEVLDYVRWCCDDQALETEFTRDGDDVVVSARTR
ncbi:MAG: CapA family protein [Chloroflexi bacterium]|nr:CapA family protein [Chloroflexota bacterium]